MQQINVNVTFASFRRNKDLLGLIVPTEKYEWKKSW